MLTFCPVGGGKEEDLQTPDPGTDLCSVSRAKPLCALCCAQYETFHPEDRDERLSG